MTRYEQAVQEELARQQQLAPDDPLRQPEPEWIIREKFSFLKGMEAQHTPAFEMPAQPDLAQATYKVGNDYYSVAEGKFVEKPASDTDVIELGGEQTHANLRATLEFYGLPVGSSLFSFSELKELKLTELRLAFEAACASATVEMDGVVYDANETANRNVAGLITSLETAGSSGPVSFCGADNSFHELTLSDLKSLQLAIIQKGQALYAAKWQIRAAIEAAESIEAVNAIRIEL